LVFSIFNAEGGIYYRYGPHWSETTATPGVGVYNGDQVELICGAFGDPVGPFNDTAWSYVNNLSRPVGKGWVDEHFINDGAPDNAFVSGESLCGPEVPGVTTGGSAGGGGGTSTGGGGSGGGGGSTVSGGSNPTSGGSLYFSPYGAKEDNEGKIKEYYGLFHHSWRWVYAPSPATDTMGAGQWYKGHDCKASYAVPNNSGAVNGKLITTLAGWSYGRNGPIMFMAAHPPWWTQINYILLIDPGGLSDYLTGVCDTQYSDMSLLIAEWLAYSSNNRLVVLAGKLTADYGDPDPMTGLAHAGLQDALFPEIKHYPSVQGRSIRKQVVVCNYDNVGHEEMWKQFRNEMNDSRITLNHCPKPRGIGNIISWNP